MYPGRRYYFLKIVETLNITRASEQLMVSQPSLTQYLNTLERDLAIKLVDRNYTPLRLTPAGNTYYEYLKTAQAQDLELEARMNEFRDHKKAALQIGVPLQKSYDFTKNMLPVIMQKHPNLYINIWEGTSNTVKEAVLKGDVEIGFGHVLTTMENEQLTMKGLRREKVIIICNAQNPILEGQKTTPQHPYDISPHLLNSQLLYQMSPNYFLFDVEIAHMKKFDVEPKRRVVLSDLYAVTSIIAESKESGFAYIPDYFLYGSLGASFIDALGFIRLNHQDINWKFAMIRRSNKALSQDAKAVWDIINCDCCAISD